MSDDQTPDEREPIEAALPTSDAGGLVLNLGPKNVEMEMRNKVAEALRQPLIPKDIEYVLVTTIMPNQQGQPMPAFALTLAIRSPMVGQMIQATAILPSPWEPQENVSKVAGELTEALLGARSAQASAQVAEEQQARSAVQGLISPN